MTVKTVDQVVFVEMSPYLGCSPDGLIGEDEGLEIKCPNDKNFFLAILENKPEKKYIDQCKMSLIVTGRKKWTLCYYNPNYDTSLLQWTVELSPDERMSLSVALEEAEKKLIEKEKLFLQNYEPTKAKTI
jgi:dihydrofolate reductase